MDCQGIGSNHVNSLLYLLEGKGAMACLGNKLGRTNIGNQKSVRGVLAGYGIAGSYVGVDDGGTLATDTQCQPIAFCCPCQVAINRGDIWMPACERRHEDRIAQGVSKEGDRGIDLVHVYLWQRLMHELYIIPICSLLGGNILSQGNAHVFNLPLLHFLGHVRGYSFLLVSSSL